MDIDELQRRRDEVDARFRAASAARDWDASGVALAELFLLERELAAARKEEHAVVIDFPVRWDRRDPQPRLVQSPERTLLLFRLEPENGQERCAVVRFQGCAMACFGGDYVDVRDDHPLEGKGLEGNVALKIVHSRWLAELSERELSMPRFYPYPWQDFQHFMFTFNDALVEAVAEAFEVTVHQRPLSEVLAEIAASWRCCQKVA